MNLLLSLNLYIRFQWLRASHNINNHFSNLMENDIASVTILPRPQFEVARDRNKEF